ncbi:MAG TPA: tetratricopeptide repeat protein [Azospirillum sp.]|nr:tetratricopeptide repeat protein [Azospirillum sp.]
MSLVDHLREALRQWEAGNLPEAERIGRDMLAGQPGHPAVLAVLAMTAQSRGDGEEALGLVRRAIARASLSADLYHNAGVILTGLGRLEEALPCFHQAAVLDPSLAPRPARPSWRRGVDGALDLDLGFDVDEAHARAARLVPPRLGSPAR